VVKLVLEGKAVQPVMIIWLLPMLTKLTR